MMNTKADPFEDAFNKILSLTSALDMCKKWMTKTIRVANRPLTIGEWVEATGVEDSDGDDGVNLQDNRLIKATVFSLFKEKKIIRLGRQTFCSNSVVIRMAEAINNVMIWEHDVCNMEELAELLFQYCPKRDQDFNFARIGNFIEKKIVTKAMPLVDLTTFKNGDFVHNMILETCYRYVVEALAGRSWKKMSMTDFFSFVRHVNVTDSLHNIYNVERIRETLKHAGVMEHILDLLEKRRQIRRESQMVLPPEPKSKRFRDLDDD